MSVGNNRGVALIITLTVITIIIAVTLEMNRQMRQSLTAAATTRNSMTLAHMVHSGVEIGKAVLAKDRADTESVSVQDDWANPEILEGYLALLPFENGNVTIEIIDKRSRLQLNSLVKFPGGQAFNPPQHELWQRFFAFLLGGQEFAYADLIPIDEDITPDMIINPIKDWIDSGDNDAITGLTGAENDYYRSLDPPYGCRNGPFKHITELMRVKNITEEIFHGFHIDNYVTVYGMTPYQGDAHQFTYDGKININTAEMPIIAALLPDGHEFLAEEIVAYREEMDDSGEYLHDLTSPQWYKSVLGMEDVEINPELITTLSDHFKIIARASLDHMTLTATVVVLREQDEETGTWKCRPLRWYYE